MKTKKILIFGVSGMLGHKLFFHLSENDNYDVYGTARRAYDLSRWFPVELLKKIQCDVDVDNFDTIEHVLASRKPDIVINCIGLIKQLPLADDPLSAINMNAQLPHRLASICKTMDARLIHISTDCVFNGAKGNYTEDDQSNATDIYGKTKYLGEVIHPHCITLRTSIIGHELRGKLGLIEWFLAQDKKVQGYTNAIYSGLPTIELAHIIDRFIIQSGELNGLYHVSSKPISKYELLKLVAKKYNRSIEIEPYDNFRYDRSLNSSLFQSITGYSSPSWIELVDKMYQDFITSNYYRYNAE
ncbi:MAG: SDR family oxidoreductase [Bacteroidota bacterium]|jgi:dTDP-4-dehydrorhamnose reductase